MTNTIPRIISTAATLALTLCLHGTAHAAACPGNHGVANSTAAVTSFIAGGGGPLNQFILPSCSSSPVGTGIQCGGGPLSDSNPLAVLMAQWPNPTARLADPSGGCSFMCPGGDCFVRGLDGLPVELLGFGVE